MFIAIAQTAPRGTRSHLTPIFSSDIPVCVCFMADTAQCEMNSAVCGAGTSVTQCGQKKQRFKGVSRLSRWRTPGLVVVNY